VWVRLDDTLDDHKKYRALNPAAGWLHIRGLLFCARQLTDGHIPEHVARDLAAQVDPQQSMLDGEHPLIALLVQRTIWERDADGYKVHDYLDYNPSRRNIERERRKRKKLGKMGAAARWQNRQKPRTKRVPTDAEGHTERHSGSHAGPHATRQRNEMPPYPTRTRTRPVPVPVPVGKDRTDVARLTDLYRATGIEPSRKDGALIAGLIKQRGAAVVEAKILELGPSIVAAENPGQYLAGACRHQRRAQETVAERAARYQQALEGNAL